MQSKSGINDQELNDMIANLQRQQRGDAAQPVRPANEKVVTPPVKEEPAPAEVNSAPTGSGAPMAPLGGETLVPTNNRGTSNTASASDDSLQAIKRDALTELRPLVDKLNLAPADKFDVLLLLIRTTNDSSLLPQAHDVARQIPDESRRAQALLSIIQEVDYFSKK